MKAVVLDGETLVGNGHLVLRTFEGEDAAQKASEFIGTLEGHERGRYWLDACIPDEEVHVEDCGCPGQDS